jgi:hypothetical protein
MLLGETLKEEYVSFADQLPVNRAWAVQMPYENPKEEMITIQTVQHLEMVGYGMLHFIQELVLGMCMQISLLHQKQH